MCIECGCKKQPVDVFKNRRTRLTRVHALEMARRVMESGGDSLMGLTTPQMPGQGPGQGQAPGPMPIPGMPRRQ